jgi:hypothetical protein
MLERLFRDLKEECAGQHNFRDFQEADHAFSRWHNQGRPAALSCKIPAKFRTQQLQPPA